MLSVHGQYDLTYPLRLAEDLAHEITGMELAVIGEAGHMAQFEQPGAWAKAVARFLAFVDEHNPATGPSQK